MSKIAILMPAYNAANYVGDALASLLRHRDAAQLEIIVVNDGSTDATGEAVAEIAHQAPEVRLIDAPHRGIACARNTALAAVSRDADFLSWLDADDLSPAGCYRAHLAQFTGDPALDFVYGRTRLFRYVTSDAAGAAPKGPFLDLRGVQLGASLIRMGLARRIGLFNEELTLGEDTDFLFRLLELHPKIRLNDEICLLYRRHEGNVTNDADALKRGMARALGLRLKRGRSAGGLVPIPEHFFAEVQRVTDFDEAEPDAG